MPVEQSPLERLGDELYAALRERRTVEPLTARHPGLSIADAYRISLRFLERRQADGQRVVGKKIGVTSKAVQQMLDVHQPDFGFLTDAMRVANGATVSLAQAGLIQPRAEGEIAFVLKSDLRGPGVTAEQVLAATDYVVPCFEIVDSRIRDWKIRIQDTIADNASCGIFLLGTPQFAPRRLDLAQARISVYRNDELSSSGQGSAVQGHPAQAVAWLANTLGEFGIPFLKGEVILSGSVTALIDARPGDRFRLDMDGVGEALVSFAA
jgi:2-oxopent-4-enoate/cis-2-oxohex-4-enoate hydratase